MISHFKPESIVRKVRSIGEGRLERGLGAALALTFLTALGIALAPLRAYALTTCTTTISGCCKITKPGSYEITGDLADTGSSSVCIKIKVSGARVFNWGGDYTITGPGPKTSTTGILITAPNSWVSSVHVTNFGIGIQSDAKKDSVSASTVENNNIGVVINGPISGLGSSKILSNRENGVVVSGKSFMGVELTASGNGSNGMVFKPRALAPYLFNSVANDNGKAGFKFNKVVGGYLKAIHASGNGTYGIWLHGTTGVPLLDFSATSNTIAGVYLGCHAQGPSNNACAPGIPATRGNMVTTSVGVAQSSSVDGPSQQYGIVIDRGNYGNRVWFIEGSSNSTFDGYDGNPNCGGNEWSSNNLTSYNQDCVRLF